LFQPNFGHQIKTPPSKPAQPLINLSKNETIDDKKELEASSHYGEY
jgi:hypothetical protein